MMMINRANQLQRLKVRYFGALHAAVGEGCAETAAQRAAELGTQAAELGLCILDMASIHALALAELTTADGEAAALMKQRAAAFFAAMLPPIESGSAGARRLSSGLIRVKRALKVRTQQLATADRRLREGIASRKLADASLKRSQDRSALLLKGSAALENELKGITRQIFAIHENRRKKMSSRLHEEIAVTLLAIHVRLLTLKKEASVNQDRVTEEIATARRLVDQSIRTINHFNREFGIQHET
jgi:signal transduction histidine kinase